LRRVPEPEELHKPCHQRSNISPNVQEEPISLLFTNQKHLSIYLLLPRWLTPPKKTQRLWISAWHGR
jgi:hypothetical protein